MGEWLAQPYPEKKGIPSIDTVLDRKPAIALSFLTSISHLAKLELPGPGSDGGCYTRPHLVGPPLSSTSRLAPAFPAIITDDQRIEPESDRQHTWDIAAAYVRCAVAFRASSTSPHRPRHDSVPPNAVSRSRQGAATRDWSSQLPR